MAFDMSRRLAYGEFGNNVNPMHVEQWLACEEVVSNEFRKACEAEAGTLSMPEPIRLALFNEAYNMGEAKGGYIRVWDIYKLLAKGAKIALNAIE